MEREIDRLVELENQSLNSIEKTAKSTSSECKQLGKAIKDKTAKLATLKAIQEEISSLVERKLIEEKRLMEVKHEEKIKELRDKLTAAKENQLKIICGLSAGWCVMILYVLIAYSVLITVVGFVLPSAPMKR